MPDEALTVSVSINVRRIVLTEAEDGTQATYVPEEDPEQVFEIGPVIRLPQGDNHEVTVQYCLTGEERHAYLRQLSQAHHLIHLRGRLVSRIEVG